MAIENLQKSEGIASHKSSLLNSHVSQPGTFLRKKRQQKLNVEAVCSTCDPHRRTHYLLLAFLTLCTVPLTFINVSASFPTDSFLLKKACRMYRISLHDLKSIDFFFLDKHSNVNLLKPLCDTQLFLLLGAQL